VKPIRVIVHAGPWKTGSTTLQEFFYSNRELFIRHGVLYPDGSVEQNAHHEIPNLIANSMSRFYWLPNISQIALTDVLKKCFEELNFRNISTLLFSSEDFAALNSDQYNQFIELLSQENDITLEIIWFDFDPINRLSSFQNQLIRQGEYVDSIASEQIVANISGLKGYFEDVVSKIPATVHRIDYDALKGDTEIFQICLDLILNENRFQDKWVFPTSRINSSIPTDKLKILNEFNQLNIGERQFDESCPVVFSDSYPEQKNRFEGFFGVLTESLERDALVGERDALVGERDSIITSRTWRALRPYRAMRSLFQKNKETAF